MNNLPIGVFDSGLGGLTVLNELKIFLPDESFIYFGDTAHVPYGNKSKESIIKFSQSIIDFLDSQPVKLIIVACNTVSSLALKKIKTKTPIISVIDPVYNYFYNNINFIQSVGVIGTENTIKSKSYVQLIQRLRPEIPVYSQSCPLLVPIIEEGLENHEITQIILQDYLEEIKQHNISLLILGCTHYPIIKRHISNVLSHNVDIVDSAELTATYVKDYVIKNKITHKQKHATIKVYVSDKDRKFKFLSKNFLNHQIDVIEKIEIWMAVIFC